MAIFQKSVFIIASVIFVICIIFIGIALRNSKSNQTYPPIVPDCPDYWIDLSGNGTLCSNIKDLGTCNSQLGPDGHAIMNFNQSPYTGSDGLCAKYNWANGCGLTWDGITSGVANPCTVVPPS
jgi:hypothetical protein